MATHLAVVVMLEGGGTEVIDLMTLDVYASGGPGYNPDPPNDAAITSDPSFAFAYCQVGFLSIG